MLTEDEQAKHTFSLHQDRLFWSRSQFLTVVQSGVLAGVYALRPDHVAQILLTIFGAVLSLLIILLAERDRYFGRQAFNESNVRPVSEKSVPLYARLKGRWFNWIVLGVLLIAESTAIWYFRANPPAPTQPVPIQVEVRVARPE